MKLPLSLLTLLFVLPLSIFVGLESSARVRETGNGGGTAEMEANFVWQRLELLVQPCLMNPLACQLTDEEQSIVAATAQTMPQERQGDGLVFYFASPGESSTELPFHTINQVGSLVELNAEWMYASQGVAQPLSHIGALVLAAVMSHHTGLSQTALIQLGEKVMKGLGGNDSQMTLSTRARPLLHHMTLSRAGLPHSELLFVETSDGTFDLSAMLLNKIPCTSGVGAWSIANMNLLGWAPGSTQYVLVGADIQWTCQTGGGSGALRLTLPIVDQTQAFKTSSMASILGIIRN
jgi:hypothetical protein